MVPLIIKHSTVHKKSLTQTQSKYNFFWFQNVFSIHNLNIILKLFITNKMNIEDTIVDELESEDLLPFNPAENEGSLIFSTTKKIAR